VYGDVNTWLTYASEKTRSSELEANGAMRRVLVEDTAEVDAGALHLHRHAWTLCQTTSNLSSAG
jgi:hypothetical protein